MIEGHAWKTTPIHLVIPVDQIPGLKKLTVEVLGNGLIRDCIIDGCYECEKRGSDVALEEATLSSWILEIYKEVDITFERVAA